MPRPITNQIRVPSAVRYLLERGELPEKGDMEHRDGMLEAFRATRSEADIAALRRKYGVPAIDADDQDEDA